MGLGAPELLILVVIALPLIGGAVALVLALSSRKRPSWPPAPVSKPYCPRGHPAQLGELFCAECGMAIPAPRELWDQR